MNYDVIILGLGGMGSSAAAQIARRGKKVLGIERFGPVHNLGSSHGGSRIIRQSYFEDPAYVPLLLRSYELWEELAKESEKPVYEITGGLYMGPETSATFAGSLCAAQKWELPHEVLTPAEVHKRYPEFTLAAEELALYEPLGGFARPELTVEANLAKARRYGAELFFHNTVNSWSATQEQVTVHTNHGSFTAENLIINPGAWAPEVLSDLNLPINIERHVLYWFDDPQGVSIYENSPVYIHETANVEQIYGFPSIDGPHGGVKTSFFRKGIPTTADTINRYVDQEEIDTMQERVTRLLPGLTGTLKRSVTCMYSVTPDEHFIIAPHPKYPRITIACGFSGHGFKFVPVVGEILADLAINGSTQHPIELFNTRRFTPRFEVMS